MKLRIKPLLGGIATLLTPSLAGALGRRNYPRVTAKYYYTVWLRHVCTAAYYGAWESPETVLEIGPGKAIGAGVAALLSGASQYIAYDANPLLQGHCDVRLLEELAALFEQKAAFAENDPLLPVTAFPSQLFSTERLAHFLSEDWQARIRHSLQTQSDLLRYVNDPAALEANTADYLFSHSVLEHVENLEEMYALMWKWLKPGGIMTHSIDFTAHGTSPQWNGQWTIPDWMWRLMKGKRLYFLNRAPVSTHQTLLVRFGFELKGIHLMTRASLLTRDDLTDRFQHLSESDLTTTTAFLVARKPLS
jgi:SAM-dependent methyltransferase